jgi:hypothetical protein
MGVANKLASRAGTSPSQIAYVEVGGGGNLRLLPPPPPTTPLRAWLMCFPCILRLPMPHEKAAVNSFARLRHSCHRNHYLPSLSGGDGSSGGALGQDSRARGAERCGRIGFVYAYVVLSGPSAPDRTSDLRFDIQSSRPGTFGKVHQMAKMSLDRDRTAENVYVVRELRVVPVIMSLICLETNYRYTDILPQFGLNRHRAPPTACLFHH